ncbi:MAG: phospho-sugar mutase [Coprobacillus sp.]|nr:phospho-sugar mutase [Coprobacillus sp.]
MRVIDNYNRWLNSPKVSKETKTILKSMTSEEIDDAFYKDIEFGTAGMRGVLGPGTNRLNEFTITKACVGYAKYLLEKYPNAKSMGVVISHDNRHMSREFTLLCAKVLNDFGINTYIFDSLRPTPELSFTVHYLKACGGIMITASHNPKEYNGFKVYDEKGCQLVPSKIGRLLEIIGSLPNELEVDYKAEKKSGVNTLLSKEVDDAYVKAVEAVSLHPELDKSDFKIVFSPSHGTTYRNMMRIFKDLGYSVFPVRSQCNPDPNFSNTRSPNPEDPKSFEEGIKLAEKINADLIIVTDPDGDRVGLAYHSRTGVYKLFNGNESACLLFEYLCKERAKQDKVPKDPVMYTTIVSSPLGEKIAQHYGVTTKKFLTGFKYIGNQIGLDEEAGHPTFFFGYEESYGCLPSPIARDKDGLQAALMYAEMAVYYRKKHDINLGQAYTSICEHYGYHLDVVRSVEFKGSTGASEMEAIMTALRTRPFKALLGYNVTCIEDYQSLTRTSGGKKEKINLPKSDVLRFTFSDGSVLAVRPSGTEPKIKFYVSIVDTEREAALEKCDMFFMKLNAFLNL